ncbi:MAG: TolC family protein [Nitrospinaceae bacterium]
MHRWIQVGLPTALILILMVSRGFAQPEEYAKFRQNLQEFIDIALEVNPVLKKAQNRIKVSQEIPDQAASLDDPILRLGLMNVPVDTFKLGQEAMTQKQVTLSQKLPFPGKLGLREDIARKDVGVTEQAYERLKLSIKRQVKQSYYELCFVLAAIDITRENKTLLEQFVTITSIKYGVGKGIQQDVLKAQVELSKIMDELIKLNKRKESEQARLNTLMDRLPQTPLSISHGIRKTSLNFEIEELQGLTEESNPSLQELTILKEKFQLSRKLAKKEYYPDFNVGFRYGQRENSPITDHPDFLSAFVGVNIPLWYKTKQRRKVAEEAYRVDVVQEAYRDSRNLLFLRIKELLDEEARQSETLQLIAQGILPQARQSLDSAMAGYSVDKVDFLTLLDNELTLFKWQIKYHEELARHEKTLAELEQVVGTGLF